MQKRIEELTLNAWPALQTYVYDGWLLRYAEGYTKRANSVSPIYAGTLTDIEEKVARCERFYAEAGLPTVFKLVPFVPNEELDGLLEARGYRVVEPSRVMVLEQLSEVAEPVGGDVRVEDKLSESWLSMTAALLGLTEKQVDITRKMLQDRPLKQGFFTLYDGGMPVACGIGVIEDGWVSLYDIFTHPKHRGRGHAELLIRHILSWARKQGAVSSYLQVVLANTPATRLYAKLGYREFYQYWYRVKDGE